MGTKSFGALFGGIAAVVIAARLCHSGVLWADDNLPLAAAIEVARGKALYRDVWFDKPPLVAWIDLVWAARAGVALRMAGAAYVIAVAWMCRKIAFARWGEREGIFAAVFAAFFLTFGLPSAVIPLASDMLLILPHCAAIYFAWRGRAFWSGVAAGIGFLASTKAIFVLAACLLWCWPSTPLLVLGFAVPQAIALGWMWIDGSALAYYRQVWQWGSIYASHTFVADPVQQGLRRTGDWLGFQAALAIGAAIALWRERSRRMAAWIAISSAGVVLGLRFFPRYYFLLLPPMIVAASRGWSFITKKRVAVIALLVCLAVPAVRFAPVYAAVAWGKSRDLAMDRDSKAAAVKLRTLATPGDTLFVWGFRPDIFIYSQMPAGTPFLESQAISGLLADRQLFSNESVIAPFLDENRRELIDSRPTWVIDGLGLYNPAAAIANQAYLKDWMTRYHEVARTDFSILYRLR